ncbi:MAG: hypothetical protein A2142_03370 [candidate division Zixibacteria bacterium RBG_16_48_11]|nr:MAG: hypothetical protein A2142_03370 [candidate division Zixibacteria bacterium RBG_16_48_11]
MDKFVNLYLVIGFVFFNLIFGYLNRRFHPRETPVVKKEPAFMVLGTIRFLLLLIWFVIFFLAEGYKHKIFGAGSDDGRVVEAIRIIGLVLYTLGGLFMVWGRASLGEWFAARLVIKKGQRVIQEGPYKFVRHPIYVGGILALWGLALALNSSVSLFILAVPFTIFLPIVAKYEERMLVSNLKGEYEAYQSRVKKFMPGTKNS